MADETCATCGHDQREHDSKTVPVCQHPPCSCMGYALPAHLTSGEQCHSRAMVLGGAVHRCIEASGHTGDHHALTGARWPQVPPALPTSGESCRCPVALATACARVRNLSCLVCGCACHIRTESPTSGELLVSIPPFTPLRESGSDPDHQQLIAGRVAAYERAKLAAPAPGADEPCECICHQDVVQFACGCGQCSGVKKAYDAIGRPGADEALIAEMREIADRNALDYPYLARRINSWADRLDRQEP